MLQVLLVAVCVVAGFSGRGAAQVLDPVQWDLLALPRHFPVEGRYDDWPFIQRPAAAGPVLFETTDGPGVVVHQVFDGLHGAVRVYIDGASEPALELDATDYLRGDWAKSGREKSEPIAATCGGWGVIALPIPFNSSCRIESSQQPRSGWVTYRRAPAGTTLPRLDVAAIDEIMAWGKFVLRDSNGLAGQELATGTKTFRGMPYLPDLQGLQCTYWFGFGGTVPRALPATKIDMHLSIDGVPLTLPATVATARALDGSNTWRNRFPLYSNRLTNATVDLAASGEPVIEFVWRSEQHGPWTEASTPGRVRIIGLPDTASSLQPETAATIVGVYLTPGIARSACGIVRVELIDDRGEQTFHLPLFATGGEESWCGFPGNTRTQGAWMLRVRGLTIDESLSARVLVMSW